VSTPADCYPTGRRRVLQAGQIDSGLSGATPEHRENLARDDFDRLKATLHNCVRHGPLAQNRDSHPSFREHLAGRIAFVESVHPERGSRLRAIFEKIDWA
jgi:hypothetical protein